ncbi:MULTISPECIES: DUF4383 domain-containing protein [unclassified Brachybacterium]|uniref:DUF4383 domain-containing protein n=1 Tax=unclassified Brachybacterium TaxID=2623841 RepID=UPI0036230E3F
MTTARPDPASSAGRTPGTGRSPIQIASLVYGVIFLLVGIAGFIPGLTADVGSMQLAGHHSEAMLMGIFQVSILHNVVHLLYGIAGLALASRPSLARLYFLVGGAVYLVLWIYGLVIGDHSMANFVPLNTADDWLHFVLGVSMIGLSFLPRLGPGRTATATQYGGAEHGRH